MRKYLSLKIHVFFKKQAPWYCYFSKINILIDFIKKERTAWRYYVAS